MQQRLGPQASRVAEDLSQVVFAVDFGRRMAGIEDSRQHVLARHRGVQRRNGREQPRQLGQVLDLLARSSGDPPERP